MDNLMGQHWTGMSETLVSESRWKSKLNHFYCAITKRNKVF
jgi:hypothetical protein